MYQSKCLLTLHLFLLTINLTHVNCFDTVSSLADEDANNSTNVQRGVKKLLRLQLIRNRIFNHLRLNQSQDNEDSNDASSLANDNLQFDSISDSDKFNQIIPLLNLTSPGNSDHKNHRIIARCLRRIGKVDNISSLLSKSQSDAREFHLYFPPSPHFRPKASHDTNSTLRKFLLKLHKKQLTSTALSSEYLVNIYRSPIISLDSNRARDSSVFLTSRRVEHNFSGWMQIDLTQFYLYPHVYDKLVNSLVVVNATDIHRNPVDVSALFTPTDCDVESPEDTQHQPALELREDGVSIS